MSLDIGKSSSSVKRFSADNVFLKSFQFLRSIKSFRCLFLPKSLQSLVFIHKTASKSDCDRNIVPKLHFIFILGLGSSCRGVCHKNISVAEDLKWHVPSPMLQPGDYLANPDLQLYPTLAIPIVPGQQRAVGLPSKNLRTAQNREQQEHKGGGRMKQPYRFSTKKSHKFSVWGGSVGWLNHLLEGSEVVATSPVRTGLQ